MSDYPVVEVRRNKRGAWCVYLDGNMVSDHATYDAAVRTAHLHMPLTRLLPPDRGHR